jgi:tRNA pseudouridine38-40 synthase
MNRECAALVGEHDFTTFAARREADESMIRTVLYAHASGRGSQIEFEIGADGFLWHMVRSIVGTLVEREQQRARGRSPDPTIREALAARDRTLAGTTAPAWGLFLHDVEYDL